MSDITKQDVETARLLARIEANQEQLMSKLDSHITEWKETKKSEHEKWSRYNERVDKIELSIFSHNTRIKNVEETIDGFKRFFSFNAVKVIAIIAFIGTISIGGYTIYMNSLKITQENNTTTSLLNLMLSEHETLFKNTLGVNYEKSND